MINFKQWDSWGNNFNNWDEALLSDSNRPRDEFWFKVKPWMQSDKWDWRSSNKNINLQQAIYKSAVLSPWLAWWATAMPDIPVFKTNYTASDFSSLDWYVWATGITYSAWDIAWDRKAELFGSTKTIIEDWNTIIVPQVATWVQDWMIFIWESGTYILQAYSDFFFPYWYDSNNSYLYKEYVYLYSYDKKKKSITIWVRNQARACSAQDWLNTLFVWWLPKGTWLTIWVTHTYTNPVMCFTALNVYRLS